MWIITNSGHLGKLQLKYVQILFFMYFYNSSQRNQCKDFHAWNLVSHSSGLYFLLLLIFSSSQSQVDIFTRVLFGGL